VLVTIFAAPEAEFIDAIAKVFFRLSLFRFYVRQLQHDRGRDPAFQLLRQLPAQVHVDRFVYSLLDDFLRVLSHVFHSF
jgi:hypothetical protein